MVIKSGELSRPIHDDVIAMDQIILQSIRHVLSEDHRVIFVYLYGSSIAIREYNDIDIAVYAQSNCNPLLLSADIKISLSAVTDIAPDVYDVRIINDLLEKGDVFALLYLKEVLEYGKLIVDNDSDLRTDFIEAYGTKYRECEGLIAEVLA